MELAIMLLLKPLVVVVGHRWRSRGQVSVIIVMMVIVVIVIV